MKNNRKSMKRKDYYHLSFVECASKCEENENEGDEKKTHISFCLCIDNNLEQFLMPRIYFSHMHT